MTNYLTADTDLTAVADAIRAKGGTNEPLSFPQGFVDAIDAIETGGGVVSPDWSAFALGTWPTGDIVLNSEVKQIPSFSQFKAIRSISAPEATTVASFNRCSALETVNLPKVASISQSVFSNCPKLKSGTFPACTTVGGSAFNESCYQATGDVIFVFPSLKATATDCFRYTSGTSLDFGESCATLAVRTIYQGRWRNVILRKKDSVVALESTSSVGVGTYGLNQNSTVFVPSALLSDYASATNWSSAKASLGFSFAPIEGSVYEFNYADGTPIPTT